jgi:hypothetical protein
MKLSARNQLKGNVTQGDLPYSAKGVFYAEANEHNRRRRRLLADHDVGGLNHGGSAVPDLQAKLINCLVGDR